MLGDISQSLHTPPGPWATPGLPCLTATFSEGLATLTAVSCCSMSAKWQVTVSATSCSPAASSLSGKGSCAGLSSPGPEREQWEL